MLFRTVALISFVASVPSALAAKGPAENCLTQGIYHSKIDGRVTRYKSQSLESSVDECLSHVISIVDWTRERFTKPVTSWSFDSAAAKAYGTMRPGDGSRVMPLCQLADYLGTYKKARLAASNNSILGFASCLERAGEHARALGTAGFVRFSYGAGDYAAEGVIGR